MKRSKTKSLTTYALQYDLQAINDARAKERERKEKVRIRTKPSTMGDQASKVCVSNKLVSRWYQGIPDTYRRNWIYD